MQLYSKSLYHVYNQGNNKEITFKDKQDFRLFLSKIEVFVHPNCKLLSYCFMPNHFHFLLLTTKKSIEKIKVGSLTLTQITNGFRLGLSRYPYEFNKKHNRSGSLFR